MLEAERVVPWGDPGLFAWHRARYELAAGFVDGRRVLDVGCGEGYGASLLATRACEVVAVDYSQAAIEHARGCYIADNLEFRLAEAERLPPELGAFDVITCFEVIEHLRDPDAALATFAELLGDGGLLLVSTPNRLVERLFDAAGDAERNPYHLVAFSPSELRRLLRRHFAQVALYGQSRYGNALHSLLKMLDVGNLRHRLVRSHTAQRSLGAALASSGDAPPRFRFSRTMVRQSPILVAVVRPS
ncbi:MAG: class I SAM-dependent methyltransferase [Gaiellaceae bacterium]